ncbi:2-dehydro-3-deoxyphosphogluconate aldolase [Paenibacillus sp. MY03]|uniref:bifunctional 4-hydroxy-2-oxoglutarate aldolase/2-dehydro-3-deoxy-phosphogluconate aldolase n=1 Tax=Paenibacillus sp. MY03 TaxID=302980 RepID=UPI000B3D00AC|nr:bifunctional 4-hydroxy-2-oxoglutarate aldolase/2-dehydro-3-deoxy-phosphogluconate aldolase [Paenibacillus sp. MY03]OUS78546.1 2-dehydro-3-deoxyphosphogluconate aldolase [Paenibacillus sp. MY03]
MEKKTGLELLEQTKIIAIVRGIQSKDAENLAQALLDGGIRVMEITLNTPGAEGMIQSLQMKFGERMYIGAGTVLDSDDAKRALDAGADFFVTPNTDESVIRYATEHGKAIFPGAMTPTEVVRAWKAGATAVKIFPGASLGLGYFKELMGPLNHIPMVAVGGVHAGNLGEFLRVGCSGVGVGGSLVNLQAIASGQWDQIRDNAKQFIQAVDESRNA